VLPKSPNSYHKNHRIPYDPFKNYLDWVRRTTDNKPVDSGIEHKEYLLVNKNQKQVSSNIFHCISRFLNKKKKKKKKKRVSLALVIFWIANFFLCDLLLIIDQSQRDSQKSNTAKVKAKTPPPLPYSKPNLERDTQRMQERIG
jgi:hypothetical protein